MVVGNSSERYDGLLPTPSTEISSAPLAETSLKSAKRNSLKKPFQGILGAAPSAPAEMNRGILGTPFKQWPLGYARPSPKLSSGTLSNTKSNARVLEAVSYEGILPTPRLRSSSSIENLLPSDTSVAFSEGGMSRPSSAWSESTSQQEPDTNSLPKITSVDSFVSRGSSDNNSKEGFNSDEFSPRGNIDTKRLTSRSADSITQVFQSLAAFSKRLSTLSETLAEEVKDSPKEMLGQTGHPQPSPEQHAVPAATLKPALNNLQAPENETAVSNFPVVDVRELVAQGKLPIEYLMDPSQLNAAERFPGAWAPLEELLNRSWGLTMRGIPLNHLKANAEHKGLRALVGYLDRIDAAVYPRPNRSASPQNLVLVSDAHISFAQKFGVHALSPAMRYHDEARILLNTMFGPNACGTFQQMNTTLRLMQNWVKGEINLMCPLHDGIQGVLAANIDYVR